MCLAVPVKIIELETDSQIAQVEHQGVKFRVATHLTPNLKINDYVLVHAGFIIEKLSDEDANQKLELFEEYYQKIK